VQSKTAFYEHVPYQDFIISFDATRPLRSAGNLFPHETYVL